MTQPGLGDNSLPTKQKRLQNKYFFRLPPQYISFFQAMANDYYKKGKIASPSIALLAKMCLITAGHSWNRMMLQLMTQEFEKSQKVEQEQQLQNYQQRREFVQTSHNLAPLSVPNIRPLPFVEEINKRLQREARNPVNKSMTERWNPNFTPILDTSSMTWKPGQHQSQPRPKDRFYYHED